MPRSQSICVEQRAIFPTGSGRAEITTPWECELLHCQIQRYNMAVQERLALRYNLLEAKWEDQLLSSGQSYHTPESCQKLNSVRQCWCDWPGCCFPACRTWLRLTYYNCRRTSPWRHIDKLHITMVQRYFILSLGFLTDCRKSGLEQTSLQSQVVTQMHCVGISLVTNK